MQALCSNPAPTPTPTQVAPAAVERRVPFRLRGPTSRLGAAEQIATCRYSAKPFAFLRDAPSLSAMQALCRQLGAIAPLPSLAHQLLHIVLAATR